MGSLLGFAKGFCLYSDVKGDLKVHNVGAQKYAIDLINK